MKYCPEQLWLDFSRPLRSFILKRVANAEDAEDLLQEVFVKIQSHLDGAAEPRHIHAWVYTIARNTMTDYYRKSHRQTVPLSWPSFVQRPEDDDPSAHREMAACLKVMIHQLPDIYREAIHLTEIQGMTQRELSMKAGITLSGAKSRVQRGRKMLKEMLLACCQVETDRRGNVIDYEQKNHDG